MRFSSEAQMSEQFRHFLDLTWKNKDIELASEVKGLFGRPDYVAFKTSPSSVDYIVSFELKLRNWKQGLMQSFRYRNFSNESILVLDKANIKPALVMMEDFECFNIGLASFSTEGEFEMHFRPTACLPFSNDFSQRVMKRYIEHVNWVGPQGHKPSSTFFRSVYAEFPLTTFQA